MQTLWRDEPIAVSRNPMTRVFGFAPGVKVEAVTTEVKVELGATIRTGRFVYVGPQCGSCEFLTSHLGSSHRFYKCTKRGVTNGAATDRRVRWPACGLYVASDESKTPRDRK